MWKRNQIGSWIGAENSKPGSRQCFGDTPSRRVGAGLTEHHVASLNRISKDNIVTWQLSQALADLIVNRSKLLY